MCGGKKWYNVNKEKSKAVKEMLYKKGEIKRGVSEIVDTEMLVPKLIREPSLDCSDCSI